MKKKEIDEKAGGTGNGTGDGRSAMVAELDYGRRPWVTGSGDV